MKRCSKCKEIKDLKSFNKDKQKKDGLSPRCFSCLKLYRILNSEKKKEYSSNYSKNNREKINERVKKNYYNNPKNKLSINIRCLIYSILKRKNYIKSKKTEIILGCSFEEFKIYIESLWEPWMNWGNHGLYNGTLNYGWDLDHIIPLSSAKSEEEIYKLNYYTNFQPLCSYINRVIKRSNENFKP
jgi:hypothetical protein